MTGAAGLGLDGRILVRTARCQTRRDGVRVRDALDGMDSDTGLPRSAVLVVRRLEGTLAGNPPRLDGVGLRTVAAAAHRASSAPPPADCEAVLFADEAELLTSLCRDVAHRRPLGWWWSTLLGAAIVAGPHDFAAAATVGLSRFPRALPAATARAPDAVAAATALLPDVDVLRVVGAMADTHGAHPTAAVLRDAWQHALTYGSAASGERRQPTLGTLVARSDTDRPGGPAVRDGMARAASGPAASPLVAVLVDTALRLHRDPVGARSAAAAASTAARLSPGLPAVDVSPTGPALRGSTAPIDDARDRRSGSVAIGPGPPDRKAERATPPAESALPDPAGVGGRATSATPGRVDVAADAADDADARRDVETDGHGPSEGVVLVDTALGGAFYLLNVLATLDLPDSADGPGEPGGSLTRWGVLALVLRCWPGVDPDDPLHAVLADLAWPAQPGPFDVQPTDRNVCGWVYRRPRTAPFPSSASGSGWRRDDSCGRSVVLDPVLAADPVVAGAAVIADVPHRSDPLGGVAGSLRWATRVGQLVQAVLAQRGVGPDVVRVPARVKETGFSVRVHMALDEVDLDVRRAGFDRDPGWVPALGRVVELVYA